MRTSRSKTTMSSPNQSIRVERLPSLPLYFSVVAVVVLFRSSLSRLRHTQTRIVSIPLWHSWLDAILIWIRRICQVSDVGLLFSQWLLFYFILFILILSFGRLEKTREVVFLASLSLTWHPSVLQVVTVFLFFFTTTKRTKTNTTTQSTDGLVMFDSLPLMLRPARFIGGGGVLILDCRRSFFIS